MPPNILNHIMNRLINRRHFSSSIAVGAAALASSKLASADQPTDFQLRYMLASCMYGYTDLAAILPEVAKVGATAIDIWPKVHGNQREQLDKIGEAAFAAQLHQHNITLGCITQYKLGPFGLQEEMRLAQRLGCHLIVCGGKGPVGLQGGELKAAVKAFIEKMKPHLAIAAETGVTIAIENHGNNLIDSPDSMKWLAEYSPSKNLAVAFAPYHLPQDEQLQADLLRALGNRIAIFYAWQHGMGCAKKLPKEQELLQMPGRGELDFAPLLQALREIQYHGWTEIFMHPVPRGIPILESTAAVTAEINRSRDYLAKRLNNG